MKENPFFKVQYSILSSKALGNLVTKHYAFIDKILLCRFINIGLNDTYFLKTNKNNYFLRVYRYKWRTQKEIKSEINYLNHLKNKNINVSFPIKKHNGSYITSINAPEGKRYLVLFSEANGQLKSFNQKRCISYGELVGKIHEVSGEIINEINRFEINSESKKRESLISSFVYQVIVGCILKTIARYNDVIH